MAATPVVSGQSEPCVSDGTFQARIDVVMSGRRSAMAFVANYADLLTGDDIARVNNEQFCISCHELRVSSQVNHAVRLSRRRKSAT